MRMSWKRWTSVLLAVCMICSLALLPVSAEEHIAVGSTTEPTADTVAELPAVAMETVGYTMINNGGETAWARFVAPYTGNFYIEAANLQDEQVITVTLCDETMTDRYTESHNYCQVLYYLEEGQSVVIGLSFYDPTATGEIAFIALPEDYYVGGYEPPAVEGQANAPSADDVAELFGMNSDMENFANINNGGERAWARFESPVDARYYLIAFDINDDSVTVEADLYDTQMNLSKSYAGNVIEEPMFIEEGESVVLSVGYEDPDATGQIVFILVMEMPMEDVPSLEEMTPITLNETATANVEEPGQSHWFTFTPEEDGVYMFLSQSGDDDTYACMYGTDFELLAESDDDGPGSNFMLPWNMTAGTTYVFETEFWSDSTTGSFPVTVQKSPVIGAQIQKDIYVYEHSLGDYGYVGEETEDYFHYVYWGNAQQYTVTLADGSSDRGIGRYYYYNTPDGTLRFNFHQQYAYQNPDNPWMLGETYAAQMEFLGVYHDVDIHIVEAPENVSVQLYPLTTSHSYLNWGYDADGNSMEYVHYEWWENLYGTVTIDGIIYEVRSGWFTCNGVEYPLWTLDGQSPENEWQPGEVRIGTAGIMNAQTEVEITVLGYGDDGEPEVIAPSLDEMQELVLDVTYTAQVDIPDQMVWYKFTPTETDAYTFASYAEDADTYCTLYDADLNELERDDDGGSGLNFGITHTLEAGQTYIFATEFLGVDVGSFPVKLTASPVESIQILEDISIVEGTYGYFCEEDGRRYYYYDWVWEAEALVTFKDGTTTRTDGNSFEYDGAWYYLDVIDSQGVDTPWEAGNTYTGTLSFGSASADVQIAITESPFVSVEMDEVVMYELMDGWYDEEYDEDSDTSVEYFTYDWWNRMTYTITLKDGSTIEGQGREFEYDGNWYYFEYENNQGVNNQYQAGQSYARPVRLGNLELEVVVHVQPSPVAEVNAKPVMLDAYLDGDWEYHDHNDEWCEYFGYYWWNYVDGTVVFNDGTKVALESGGFVYDGQWYNLEHQDNQQEEHWQPGDVNNAVVSIGGKECNVTVAVLGTDTDAGVAELNGVIYTTVEEALNNAVSGDVVTLTANSLEYTHLTVDEGVTLDLAGYDLVAKSLNGLSGSFLNATRYGNDDHGRLFVPQERLSLSSVAVSNGQNKVIPYWDPVDGCYVMANTRIKDVEGAFVADEETKTISFKFSYGAGSAANKDFLVDGADDNAMDIVVRLQWESENGVAYQDFVYKNVYVSTLAQSGGNFTFQLTGYDMLNINLDTFSIVGMVLCDCGIIVSGTEYSA